MNAKGFQIGLALALEACLLFGLGMWLVNFTHPLVPHAHKIPITVRWIRRVPPHTRKPRTLVHAVPSVSPAAPPLPAAPVVHLGDALASIRTQLERSVRIPLQSIPESAPGAGSNRGGGSNGRSLLGRLPLPGWGLPDSGLRVRQLSFVCPRPVDRAGAIIFEGRVNTQGRVQSAWVIKSNWDHADQRGVIWAVRLWRFTPLVINGRLTSFAIVGKIRVTVPAGAQAICGGLIATGGFPSRFIPFTWVVEHAQNGDWIAFSVRNRK